MLQMTKEVVVAVQVQLTVRWMAIYWIHTVSIISRIVKNGVYIGDRLVFEWTKYWPVNEYQSSWLLGLILSIISISYVKMSLTHS